MMPSPRNGYVVDLVLWKIFALAPFSLESPLQDVLWVEDYMPLFHSQSLKKFLFCAWQYSICYKALVFMVDHMTPQMFTVCLM